jgi:casein kinase II subunit alpha
MLYVLDNFRIDWSEPDRYEIVRRVGGGKYSEVSPNLQGTACSQWLILT